MIKKSSYQLTSDYVLVILLLIFSGDPIIRYAPKPTLLLVSAIILVVMYSKIKKDFFTKFFIVGSSLLVLFILQNVILNFLSWLGAINYISNFFFGGLIFYLVAERLSFRLFIVIYYVSLISLVLFVIINLLNIHLPGLTWHPGRVTHIIYTFVEQHHYRNCGMFWEPGAFAGILTLCIALNAKDIPALWKNHKFKIFIILVALLTTKSTTGYVVLFLIMIYYIVFFVNNNLIKIALIPTLLLIIFVVYENADFLQQKINQESEKSLTLGNGQFSNSRFGSFMMDLHYIKKHPLLGNGLHEKTRYADDPLLIIQIESGDDIASGNGFSNYLACMGIPFMFFYLFICFTTIAKVDLRLAFLVVFVILLSLWGEQWLQYPIYTGMIFINLKKYINESKQHRRFDGLPQPQG